MKLITYIRYIATYVLVIVLSALIFIEFSYRAGLALVPDVPLTKEHNPLPVLVTHAIWVSFYEDGPKKVTPLTPWNILARIAIGTNIHGNKVVTFISKKLLGLNDTSRRMLIHHLQVFSLGIWLSRNWTTEQVMSAVGDHIIWKNIKGIDNIANQLFRKQVNCLDIGEIALIMAIARGGFAFENKYRSEQLKIRRDHILKRMLINGAITEEDYRSSTSEPINFVFGLTE